jgi:hypothetical protein
MLVKGRLEDSLATFGFVHCFGSRNAHDCGVDYTRS